MKIVNACYRSYCEQLIHAFVSFLNIFDLDVFLVVALEPYVEGNIPLLFFIFIFKSFYDSKREKEVFIIIDVYVCGGNYICTWNTVEAKMIRTQVFSAAKNGFKCCFYLLL